MQRRKRIPFTHDEDLLMVDLRIKGLSLHRIAETMSQQGTTRDYSSIRRRLILLAEKMDRDEAKKQKLLKLRASLMR